MPIIRAIDCCVLTATSLFKLLYPPFPTNCRLCLCFLHFRVFYNLQFIFIVPHLLISTEYCHAYRGIQDYMQAGLCLSRVRPVGSPSLSLHIACFRTANHTHLPRNVSYACCYSGLFGWKQRKANCRDIYRYVGNGMSLVFVFRLFRHCIMCVYCTCSTAYIPE